MVLVQRGRIRTMPCGEEKKQTSRQPNDDCVSITITLHLTPGAWEMLTNKWGRRDGESIDDQVSALLNEAFETVRKNAR